MTRTLTRRPRCIDLRNRIGADDRRSAAPVDALRIRLALARPTDAKMAGRLRYALLESEVTERLRALR